MTTPPSLRVLFPDLPVLVATDIGASDLDGDPPYQRWKSDPRFRLIGFEPSPEEFAKLVSQNAGGTRFYPYALGDGRRAELNICRAPGMTSLLMPEFEVLRHFHGFAEWATVEGKAEVQTHRLDDLTDLDPIDYLKIDVQGSELDVLANGTNVLQAVACVHIEVNFVPFYIGQPLFAEIDQFLRRHGFLFHRFSPVISRTLVPFLVDNDIYRGLSQQLWADAVYFRRFTDFPGLPPERLAKTALIAHDLYEAFDLAHLALVASDQLTGEDRSTRYLQFLGIA